MGDTLGAFSQETSGMESYAAATRESTRRSQKPGQDGAAEKKRAFKFVGGGLRQLSVMVREKVETKRITTHNEVADEIIAELAATQINSAASLDEFDEKNIRRRVYDAINVLLALDIIAKDRKEIQWRGLSSTNANDMEEIKTLGAKMMTRIGKKAAYLKDLEEQIAGLQVLMLRNQWLLKSENAPSQGFSLPFILVRTTPNAMVEIEISEDMQFVHFDFNSTPFSLHDDASILKQLQRYQQLPESILVSQN